MLFTLSHHIPSHTVFVSHFLRFSVFSLKSSYYSLYFSIFHLFHCFLPHIRYYSVRFSYCTFFSDICHNSCPSMWFSHFLNLSVFLPFSRTYNVSFSFSLLGSFIGIFQVLQWAFSFFMFFSVSRHIPCHTVFVSHFPLFSVSCHTLGPAVCIFHFPTFFSVSCHISSPTMWVSHLLRLPQFSPYSRSYNVSFSFSLLIIFLTVFQVLQWAFLIFHVFQCFSPYSRS